MEDKVIVKVKKPKAYNKYQYSKRTYIKKDGTVVEYCYKLKSRYLEKIKNSLKK